MKLTIVTPSNLFQSAPGAKAGGNQRTEVVQRQPRCFNPPPARRPGGTGCNTWHLVTNSVSIRPRREGRGEQHNGSTVVCYGLFQSAPGAKAGGNFRGRVVVEPFALFQSAPGAKAGGNPEGHRSYPTADEFQSAPGAKAGGNCPDCEEPAAGIGVSIRPRREGRGELVPPADVTPPRRFQSAPGAKAGGNLNDRATPREDSVSIRPRREGRGEPRKEGVAARMILFQSAPGAKAGGNGRSRRGSPTSNRFQSAPGAKAGGNHRAASGRR